MGFGTDNELRGPRQRLGRRPGMISSHMPRTVTLRPWQKSALEPSAASGAPDFLAVATPGAGKTTFALTAARQALAVDPSRRLIVVVPTAHLKAQWASAAAAFDLHLDPDGRQPTAPCPGTCTVW